MSVQVVDVGKRFGTFTALESVSLAIPTGQFVGLLGPSGSGKTTLLRIIAGLESPDAGRLFFGSDDVTDLHVSRRGIGFVFQHYALFRHMTVAQNIAFGPGSLPRRDRPATTAITARVNELLQLVHLDGLGGRYPAQLSGGQRQRVALARALASRPRLLLLDEPFGALDTQVRHDLRRQLRALHQELGFTCVSVTHDQEEALELSQQVVVMRGGRIEQAATPTELYSQPANRFVYDFLGASNAITGNPAAGLLSRGRPVAGSAAGWTAVDYGDALSAGTAELRFRPTDLVLDPDQPPSAGVPLQVRTVQSVLGQDRVELSPLGWQSVVPWEVLLPHGSPRAPGLGQGDRVFATPRRGALFLPDRDSPVMLEWPDTAQVQ